MSVIVPTHDYGRFLGQCLDSVLGQTHADFELVVVDDGSEDDTPAVLEKYARNSKVSLHRLPGVGLAAACNHGIRLSHGEYVLRLDADDFLDLHALGVMSEELTRRPEIGLVYPDYHRVDEQGRFIEYVRVPRVQEGAKLLDRPPLASGCMYRRSCFDAIGGYNEALRYQEDFDFWLRFTERFQAFGLGLPLLHYRQHGASMSKNRAPRSAARRYVKRQYAEARHLRDGETVLTVIPGVWPPAPGRCEELLCRPLDGATPLERAIEAAGMIGRAAQIAVASSHPDVMRASGAAGVEVVPSADSHVAASGRQDLAWLLGLVRSWTEAGRVVPSLLLLLSPYCPLRHPERGREMIDTLLIHDCDLVLSVESEPGASWVVGPDGLRPLAQDPSSSAGPLVHEAGELLAVRTSWLTGQQPLSEPLIGYVELLHPEGVCLSDEASLPACEALLPAAARVRVGSSAYLWKDVGGHAIGA